MNPATQVMFGPEERLKLLQRGYSSDDVSRMTNLACRIVFGLIKTGKLNHKDPIALKEAVRQAGLDAKAAYDAALEYLRG